MCVVCKKGKVEGWNYLGGFKPCSLCNPKGLFVPLTESIKKELTPTYKTKFLALEKQITKTRKKRNG